MKKFSVLSFSIFILGICVCISCGYLISSALVSTGLFTNSSEIVKESQTIYAISMSKSQIKEEANSTVANLQSQNGAGFIYKDGDYYYVLASLYENKNDAEHVKTNLLNNGVSCEILTIEKQSSKLSGNFTNNEKTILGNCIKINSILFKQLFDVAVSLDTNIFTQTSAKLECNKIYSSLVSDKANFETLFKHKFEDLEKNLKRVESCLSNLISENFETQQQTFSSFIKLTYCKILLGE